MHMYVHPAPPDPRDPDGGDTVADPQPTTLLVSTRDGLRLLERRPDRWECSGPLLPGFDVAHAVRDPRDGALWAAATDPDGRPGVWRSADDGATWECPGGPFAGERAWHVRPGRNGDVWAGVMPAALLRSHDHGRSWQPVAGLNDHPSRPEWWPGGGGLCLHTILLPDGQEDRVYAGISVAGLFRSDDGGATWNPANEGTVGMAEDYASWTGQPASHPGVHRCVHKVVVHPSRPETLFMQAHVGVYRSDDGGQSWRDIGATLPSPFGFPIAAAPDPGPEGCRIWVIPQDMETLRTPDGLVVWRSTDGGATWEAGRTGLPGGQHNVLRDAMAADGRGVWFGATSGVVYGSADGGESWDVLAEDLGRIQAVEIG